MVPVEIYESGDAESAYRRILDHGDECEACRSAGAELCETAAQLDRAWRAARRSPEQTNSSRAALDGRRQR
ncbi:hypothetical protein [Streptomyces scabiei]|uniref:Uncharacterized protein n=1 Tax=Streptomyces scabiei TaxID=1930 RepID=A0A100JLS9_STRSC|nr:hypothetical protein [Streptomyces scabiei]GAQ61875.1 hypothetical protein SsS58_02229 [Streptomyces scabiei]